MRWTTTSTPPFERRNRRITWWKDGREQMKSRGSPGLHGYLTVIVDGKEARRIRSEYRPVPEVWQVGVSWTEDSGKGEEP
jgi:hypothetical protein